MDDSRPDAPPFDPAEAAPFDPASLDFELTAAPAGEDALQLGPADAAAVDTPVDGPFAMHLADVKPDEPAPAPLLKPSKPVTAAANDSVVAALMGRPIAKPTPAEPREPTDPARGVARFSGPERVEVPDPRPAEAGHASQTKVGASPTPVEPEIVHRLASVPSEPTPRTPVAAGVSPREPIAAPAPARRAVPVAPAWPTIAPIPRPPAAHRVVARPISPVLTPPPEPVREPPPAPAATSDTIDLDPAELDSAMLVPAGPTGAWWTIPLTFVGIAIVACAILIPAADENRRDGYELAKIERDVAHFSRQSEVNADFLKRVDTDPTLAERLALRQLHQTRVGVALAPLAAVPDRFAASPYALTRVDPPAPLPPYRPTPGKLGEWFLGGKNPQQMAGLGLLVAGAGVLIGGRGRGLRA